MDALLAEVGKWLISQGMFAILALVLGIRLWQRETEISAINTARLADNRENIKALTESTETQRQVAEAQRLAADASRDVAESLRALLAEFERSRR